MNPSSAFMFPSMDPLRQPKSPKSPPGIENPLLRANALFAPRAPSLSTPERRPPPIFNQKLKSVTNTPGPPPKTSLSLNMKLNSLPQPLEPSFETPPKTMTMKAHDTGSPSPFFTSQDEDLPQSSPLEGGWVIAYGFTNQRECQALLSILKASGQILATKSNSNWMAIQYPDDLCAARASARQFVPVGSILCGVSRVTGTFVHELLARQSTPSVESTPVAEISSPKPSIALLSSASFVEEDILVGYSGKHPARSDTAEVSEYSVGSSLLVKAIYYFFGWKTQ